MTELYSYERRIVCFIDILGFSNVVNGTINNGINGKVKLMNICGALNMIDDFRITMSEKMLIKDVRTTQFSDSVLISFPWIEEDNSIIAAFMWIKYLQVFLIMEHDVLLRGGITIGDIIHNEKMIVGPAMIDAYTLESKCAINPRIIIDSKVIPLFEKIFDRCRKNNHLNDTTLINKDNDDRYYIDYFNFPERDRIGTNKYMNDYLGQLKMLVYENENNENQRIRDKYLWMSNKIKTSNLIRKREFGAITITL